MRRRSPLIPPNLPATVPVTERRCFCREVGSRVSDAIFAGILAVDSLLIQQALREGSTMDCTLPARNLSPEPARLASATPASLTFRRCFLRHAAEGADQRCQLGDRRRDALGV